MTPEIKATSGRPRPSQTLWSARLHKRLPTPDAGPSVPELTTTRPGSTPDHGLPYSVALLLIGKGPNASELGQCVGSAVYASSQGRAVTCSRPAPHDQPSRCNRGPW